MMERGKLEFVVGVFVLVGILCLSYLAIKLGKLELVGGDYYELTADFSSSSGLKKGASVEIAGVKVGRVKSIVLKEDQAQVVHSVHGDGIGHFRSADKVVYGRAPRRHIQRPPGTSDCTREVGVPEADHLGLEYDHHEKRRPTAHNLGHYQQSVSVDPVGQKSAYHAQHQKRQRSEDPD